MTTPCDGKCECVDPCPSCPTRPGWLGSAVPAYAVTTLGQDWLRARAATVPFRIPFSDRRAARRHALPQSESVQPETARQDAKVRTDPSSQAARQEGEHPFPYLYRSRQAHPERYGTRCRMVGKTRGFTPAGTTVEFEDGFRAVVSNMVLRRAR